MSDVWLMGLVLNGIILVIIAIPCVGVCILGTKMINKLSYFPSKNAPIQMSILIPLMILEVFSATLLLLFYHIFVDYAK